MSKLAQALQAAAGNVGGATEGIVYAVGYATRGRIGNNLSGDAGYGSDLIATTFQNVSKLAKTTSYSYNYGFISSYGEIFSAGANQQGQLGNGVSAAGTNAAVMSVSPAKRVDGTYSQVYFDYNTAAIKTDGTLWCWGQNNVGQLGDGTVVTKSSPVQIGSDTNWKYVDSVTYSSASMLALKTDGTLWGWGSGLRAGLNTAINYSSPVQVGSDTNWSSLSCGTYIAAAIKTNGTLWTWGVNFYGTVGDGTRIYRSSPVQIGALTNWKKVVNGIQHTLAVKTDGTLWAWGGNSWGQLGTGNIIARSSPVQVGSDTDWDDVFAISDSSFARKTNGDAYMWGANDAAQTLYANDRASSPVQIGALSGFSDVSFSIGQESKYANTYRINFLIGSTVYTIRNASSEVTNNFIPWAYPVSVSDTADPTIKKIAAAKDTLLMVKSNGELWAVGDNTYGQLGQNNASLGLSRSSPVQIGSLTDWYDVSNGEFTSYGLKTDGSLWAWGRANVGQTGRNDLSDRSSPVQVNNGANTAFVSSYGSTVYVTKTDGTLWSCGDNTDGQCGINSTSTPRKVLTQVGTLTDWGAPSSGYKHAGAIKTDKTLWMWGQATVGQVGDGTRTNRSSPVQIGSLATWAWLSCGGGHTVAIQTNGTLWAWGSNGFGELGIGNYISRSSPVQVGSDTDWEKAWAGTSFTYALKKDGTLWGWGSNAGICQQIGYNLPNPTTNSPVQIGYYNLDPTSSISNVINVQPTQNSGAFILGLPPE